MRQCCFLWSIGCTPRFRRENRRWRKKKVKAINLLAWRHEKSSSPAASGAGAARPMSSCPALLLLAGTRSHLRHRPALPQPAQAAAASKFGAVPTPPSRPSAEAIHGAALPFFFPQGISMCRCGVNCRLLPNLCTNTTAPSTSLASDPRLFLSGRLE